jgi:hypothetical protein
VTPERRDPSGKEALFSASGAVTPPAGDNGHHDGKEALFSMPAARLGTLVVECSACRVRSPLSLVELLARLAMISVWYPFRRYPHWMSCPSCRRHTWCRIGWMK